MTTGASSSTTAAATAASPAINYSSISPRTHATIPSIANHPLIVLQDFTTTSGEESIAVYSFTRKGQLSDTAANMRIISGICPKLFAFWEFHDILLLGIQGYL